MATYRIRYLTERRRRDGTVRRFWQPSGDLQKKGWRVTRLPDDFEQARLEAERLNAALDAWYGGRGQPVHGAPGSVDALIGAYKTSRDWRALADKTRKGYLENLMILARLVGDKPARLIRPGHARKIADALAVRTPARAAALVRVARLLWNFGIAHDMADLNPWAKQKVPHKAKKGVVWTPEDVAAFVARADEMGLFSVGTAVFLNEWMGQRRGDLIAMSRAMYAGGEIAFTQSKTGAEVTLPVDLVPRLRDRLAAQLARNAAFKVSPTTILTARDGRPYTEANFRNDFDAVRRAAAGDRPELAHLVFKDLRHTAVTRLGEAGVTIQGIASITGHTFQSAQQILDRYNVRTKKMARAAFHQRLTNEEI